MPSSSFIVLLGILFVAGVADAQSEVLATLPGARRIELAPDDARPASEIVISANVSTGLFFDSGLLRDGIELEGRDRFSLVDVGQTTLRLVPSPRVTAGDQFRLVVRFQDGAAPRSATFLLRAHPANAEPLVEVYRGRRTIETYQQEAREVRDALVRCQQERAQLMAEHEAPAGLAGLISTKALDEHGVAGWVVTKDVAHAAGNVLEATIVRSYRSSTRVAVEIHLAVNSGAQPWVGKGAMLRTKAGVELKVLRLWQEHPISTGEIGRVVVEAEASAALVQGPFSLKLWEEDGPRTLTLTNVTFP
ncbi:DUF2381 family protein [Corallococcus exiguus]|uniref:DUF2381 family protein n=1 Tax=Corallococcus exiguus TaxID=83462 RepID=UPI003DA50387